jgi:Type II secretion system (T2SS), protein K
MGSYYPTEADAVLRMKTLSSKFEIRNSKLRSGAALMLALWALFLLSAMVISWALDINSRLAVSGNANRVLDAQAMASSGADVSLAREISPSSANLHRQMGDREGYDVQMTGECGRLNLNLLTQGEDPTKLEILRQYLTLKGVELNDVDTMIDSLLDWVSPGQGIHHLNACPETDDYQPTHAPLTSVDDLKKICGWAQFTSKPGWDEDFTVLTDCGCVDFAWASRDVMRAFGVGDDFVDRFLQLRRGPDGVDGTPDDFQFGATTGGLRTSGSSCGSLPAEVQAALGLKQDQSQKGSIGNLMGFSLPVFRVVSIGKSGDVSRTVQMIVSKQAGLGAPRVMSWKEL